MSRILRRPMFRGGKVDSRGTGITTGLDQPRIGARTGRFFGDTGNPFVPKPVTTQGIIDAYTPRGLPQSFIDFFQANQANQRPSGRFRKMGPGVTLNESELAYEEFPQVSSEMPGSNIIASADDGFVPESLKDKSFADVEIGLEETNLNPEKIDNSPKVVPTPKPGDDEPEVTMTDLEKALGLDKARQEYAADALAAASAAFFEGKGFGAIADAAAVKSKAPDIKRLAALEEFKADRREKLFDKQQEALRKQKAGTRGAFQKKLETITAQKEGTQGHIIALSEQKLQPTIQGEVANKTSKNFVRPSPAEIKGLMIAYYPQSYKGAVSATEEMTGKEAGTYITEDATQLIFWDGTEARTQSI